MRGAAIRLIYPCKLRFTINDGINLLASSHPNFREKRGQSFKKIHVFLWEKF